MGHLDVVHGASLTLQFGLGLALLGEGATWVGSAPPPLTWWSGPLALTGSVSCCLCLFHGVVKRDAVIAASVVSALWTLGAALAIARVAPGPREALTLLGSGAAQLLSAVLLAALPSETWSAAEESVAMLHQRRRAREYGALSSFVDPIAQVSAAAQPAAAGAAKTSPQLSAVRDSPPRTPSPFGSVHSRSVGTSPHRSAGGGVGGNQTPLETPDVIRASYKELLAKYELDS